MYNYSSLRNYPLHTFKIFQILAKTNKELQTNFTNLSNLLFPCPYSATFDFADAICPHLRIPVGRAYVSGRRGRAQFVPHTREYKSKYNAIEDSHECIEA